ncbi:MAG: sulfatase-like hydrolase/transferase [Cyclobacteriaceae bacterium]
MKLLFFKKPKYKITVLVVIYGILLYSLLAGAQSSKTPPNVIFIISDQMRGDAFGAAGNANIRTPNIDKLAKNGAMFRSNFVNNPVCLPSRTSMFSGMYPSQTGILNNRHDGKWLAFEKSLPWYFQQAGYRTAYIGKNHTFRPEDLDNFDVTSLRSREECRAYSKYVPPNWHSDIFWPEEDCNPAKNTKDAIDFINKSKEGEPFLLHISYFDPHPPYMAPAQYTSRYCSGDMELPDYIDPHKLGKRLAQHQKALHYDRLSEEELKETMRYYYSSVEWGIDQQIGRILHTLEEMKIVDNTIIVFTSDHGDFMGQHKMVRKGMFLYDALLRVPMIWHAPGLIREGQSLENLSQNVDIFPTLLDLAGLSIPGHLAGRSLKDIMQGKAVLDEDFTVFASAVYGDLPADYWDDPEPYFDPNNELPFHTRVENITWSAEHRTVMARTINWKLILSESHKPELYKMDGGHIEKENLYGNPKYESVAKKLERKIKANWEW